MEEIRLPTPSDPWRLDRSALSFATFEEADEADRKYWWSRSPKERMQALELLRQINYGLDATSGRLQRVFEFVERSPG